MTLRELDRDSGIVLIGDEPLAAYERPPLSKSALLGNCEPTWVFEPQRYAAQGIELRLGERVFAIDSERRVLTTARGELPYRALILATGGRPRRPAISKVAPDAVATLRSWSDACSLRVRLACAQHVTVLGGGLIGMEVAAICRQRELAVTVIEAANVPLSRVLPLCVAEALTQLHIEKGVRVLAKSALRAVRKSEGRWQVELESGATWLTDLVVAGIGLIPNTELAAVAGCRTDDGILVDEKGATDRAGIFAAGDCARFWHPVEGRHVRWESWQHAIKHGMHVARAALGATDAYNEIARGWTDQYDVNLQFAGNASGDCTILTRANSRGGRLHVAMRDGQMVGAVGWNAPRELGAAVATMRSEAAIARV
jgi:3-phenylpropionate/trans-cinnamate dioxygenase ferredoxin reductase subunit